MTRGVYVPYEPIREWFDECFAKGTLPSVALLNEKFDIALSTLRRKAISAGDRVYSHTWRHLPEMSLFFILTPSTILIAYKRFMDEYSLNEYEINRWRSFKVEFMLIAESVIIGWNEKVIGFCFENHAEIYIDKIMRQIGKVTKSEDLSLIIRGINTAVIHELIHGAGDIEYIVGRMLMNFPLAYIDEEEIVHRLTTILIE